MNKYELQIEELKAKWDYEGKKYTAEVQQINNVAMQYCNQFNSQITIVNVERHLMRREITTLYKFLKPFGNIGIKLNPFDFVTEDWLFPSAHIEKRTNEKSNHNVKDYYTGNHLYNINSNAVKDTGTAFLGADHIAAASTLGTSVATGYVAAGTAAVGMALPVFAPIALPAYWVIKDLKKKSDLKDELLTLEKEFQKERAKWKKTLDEMSDEVSFFMSAVQIANMYRGLVAVVRDTIADKILPELNGIMAFLYADAIKNCIINNEEPATATIGNISEYRGTPYESHYLFIKNVFNYYKLITTFFTRPILTELIEKRAVSEKEFEEIQTEIEKIEIYHQNLMKECIIGGDLL